MPDLYYCIAAYNEENNIVDCLSSLNQQNHNLDLETIVCLNGCTDDTEGAVLMSREKFPRLNTRIIHSNKGKTYAQNALVKSATEKDIPLVFVDADVTLDRDCIRILFEEMKEIEKLVVVGAWPVPKRPDNLTMWENFLYRILHMRAFYPEAEISVNDVSVYKDYARERPQPTMSPESEMRSKIYFHGRTFMIRNSSFFYLPEDVNTADDTFLPNFIHTHYGPGTIRTRFDAIAYYKPYLSLMDHYKTYRRVFWDLKNIDQKGEFRESRNMEKTRLNWKYIFSQGLRVTLEFITYSSIVFGEKAIYNLLPKKSLSAVWQYDKK